MSVVVVGLNHRTVPLELLERMTVDRTRLPKALHDLSKKSIGRKHPVVMLLFPNPMPAEGPAVEEKPNDIWVLNFRRPVGAGGQKGVLGLGLVIAGVSMAE